MGNTQNPSPNGGWSDRTETLYGANIPYGVNTPNGMNMPNGMGVPYGMTQSYGQNIPYTNQNPAYGVPTSYGMNQPYEAAPPYGMNQPYAANPSYGMNQPYTANPLYGMNQPYEAVPPYGMNQPYMAASAYGTNQPYAANQPYGVNQPYAANPPYGMNQPYAANPSYGMNQSYAANPSYGMNQPYEAAPAYGVTPAFGMNQPGAPLPCYGEAQLRNLPAVVAGVSQQNLPVPYQNQYQIAPNKPPKVVKQPKEGTDKLILFGIAGVLILSVIAIVIGIVLNSGKTDQKASDLFASWMQGFTSENDNEENGDVPVIDFTTQDTETIRGEFCAVGEDGSLYVRTNYGVCRLGGSGTDAAYGGYVYDGWAAELEDGVEIESMAFYDGYLYIACGENGIYRVNPARSNTFTKIIDGRVGSFVIAEDSLFYLSLKRANSANGELYIAGLNGKGQEPLGDSAHEGEKVRHAPKYMGSADFVCVDGYLYFFDEDDNLKRIHTSGNMRARMVVERARQKNSFESSGLYENGGVLYLPSNGGGIYSYDIEADRLKKVSDAVPVADAPLVFAGDALLYYAENDGSGEGDCTWRQIIEGQDTAYAGPQRFGPIHGERLVVQAVGEEKLITFFMPQDMGFPYYYTVFFADGVILAENIISFEQAYDTMPEVELEQEPQGLLPGAEAGGRSSELVYDAEDGSYRIVKADGEFYFEEEYENAVRTQGLFLIYTDETGKHVECLEEGEVQQFSVMNGVLYYTVAETTLPGEHYGFYRKSLSDGADAESEGIWIADDMGDPCISPQFSCYGGKIYYVRQTEGTPFGCYDPESGEDMQVGDISVGSCFTIWNDMVYFDDAESETLWKMNLDGTGLEQIGLPVDGGRLREIQVCPYQDSVYLAVVANRSDPDDPNMGYPEIWFFAEDGSMELLVYEIDSNFDLKQSLYFVDGRLYYSADTSYRIRVLDVEAYFEGGSGIRNAYDTVFCDENFNTFEVTQQYVYAQQYLNKDIIVVYDRLTGEQVGEIESDGWRSH